jgi:hypothetical protein
VVQVRVLQVNLQACQVKVLQLVVNPVVVAVSRAVHLRLVASQAVVAVRVVFLVSRAALVRKVARLVVFLVSLVAVVANLVAHRLLVVSRVAAVQLARRAAANPDQVSQAVRPAVYLVSRVLPSRRRVAHLRRLAASQVAVAHRVVHHHQLAVNRH